MFVSLLNLNSRTTKSANFNEETWIWIIQPKSKLFVWLWLFAKNLCQLLLSFLTKLILLVLSLKCILHWWSTFLASSHLNPPRRKPEIWFSPIFIEIDENDKVSRGNRICEIVRMTESFLPQIQKYFYSSKQFLPSKEAYGILLILIKY